MERKELEKILKDIGYNVFFASKEKLINEIKKFLEDKKFYVSKYLDIGLMGIDEVKEAEVGVFEAIALCEKTGTILAYGDDLSSLIPPLSFAILKKENIKKELDDLIDIIKENPEKSFSFITGPSRTADIEKQVVIPAHGPKEINLFIIE